MFKETDVEIWKEIDGFEGKYAVSSKGRVKNLKTGRLIGGGYDNNYGYKYVILKGKPYLIHRLVALAFIPNPNKLPQVDHRDENKGNNDVSNLRWVSKSENVRHSSHKCSCKIKQIDKDGELIKIWESIAQIEKELGYDMGSIVRVCKGRRRSAYGYRWEYSDASQQHKFNRPVAAYKGTELIGEFASVAKASEALGLKYLSVYFCLQGCHASTHGYTFRYLE